MMIAARERRTVQFLIMYLILESSVCEVPMLTNRRRVSN